MNQYETLYGVTLLDDLHNYFPALLYDSSAFSSLADMLDYVQRQARNRFDLFSYGRTQYQQQHPPRAVSVPLPSPLSHGASVARLSPFSSSGIPRARAPVENQTYTTPTVPIVLPSVPAASPSRPSLAPMFGIVEAAVEEEDIPINEETNELMQTSQALLNLLGLMPGAAAAPRMAPSLFTLNHPGRRRVPGAGLDAFLQPVIVRPTPEQIAEYTSLGNLVSDVDHACAICQETLLPEQQGRKLNACGHWFHRSCIDTWFQRDVHCPVCRHDIREPMPAAATQPGSEAQQQQPLTDA